MAESWTCPFCNLPTTVTDSDTHSSDTNLVIGNKDGMRQLTTYFTVCPNPKCKKFSLEAHLFELIGTGGFALRAGKLLKSWRLIPESNAKTFPSYIPEAIRNDYTEACLIKNLSSKASATLARRCLQGMIRDFFKVNGKDLNEEILLIKDKVEPETWEAIDSTRKIGNIGAHMEKDINLIIDVEPQEAGHLINLIEMLLKDWYINRQERKDKLEVIKEIASDKDKQKTSHK